MSLYVYLPNRYINKKGDFMIKKLPLPISGLMLALAATGNLLFTYGYVLQNFFGILSAIILFLILMKILIYPNVVIKELENPIVASVFSTLSMGIMVLSTYTKGYLGNLSFVIWICGLLLHIYFILRFTSKYIKKNIKNVIPSYFIVYVGIAIGSITAPIFHMQNLGKLLFYFGILSFMLLLPNVLRGTFTKQISEPVLPTLAIFAAPLSLYLAGYLNSFQAKNMIIVYFLLILSQFTLFLVLIQFPRLLKLKFYPSYSALTFPVVISAISLKLANGFLIISGKPITFLPYLVKLEEILSVLIVFYVLVRYLVYIFTPSYTK